MIRDARLGLLILAIGLAPAFLKKSKPLSKFVGDQLVRLGEFIREGSDTPDESVTTPPVASPELAADAVAVESEASAEPKPTAEPEGDVAVESEESAEI